MRGLSAIPLALVTLVPLASVVLVLFAPAHYWVDTLFDDAYYYLGVARHLSLGAGSVFALPLETNGYQPLWLLIVTGLAFLTGGDRTWLVAAMHVAILLSVLAFVYISWRQERRHWPAALTALCFPAVMLDGLETVLLPPLALLYFRADGWRRGGLASLIFLTRLDALGLIVGRELYELVANRKVDFRANSVLAAVALAFALINIQLFGIPVPVSGLAKSAGNVVGENWRVGLLLVLSATPALLALMLVWFHNRRRLANPMPIFAAVFALGCSAVYYGLLSGWITWDWYRWPVALLFYFVLLELVRSVPGFYRAAAASVLAVSLVTIPSIFLKRFAAFGPDEVAWGRANVGMVGSINSLPLPSATFAMGDRAGSFGYFLDDRYRFIQTEGLVADVAYLKALKGGNAERFLAAAGTDYFVVDRGKYWTLGSVYAVPEPIQGASARSGVMLLCFPKDAEILTFGSSRKERKVFAFERRVACPPAAVTLFLERQQQYGEIRRTSLWQSTPGFSFFPALR